MVASSRGSKYERTTERGKRRSLTNEPGGARPRPARRSR
jgi:hypothetical protein